MASLTQFRYALAIDKYRNFQKAAAHCFVTQPTLSMQLRKLEDELSITLFDRSRKPVEPTNNGLLILEQMRKVIYEFNLIEDLCDQVKGVVTGEYKLGIIPTMAPMILPRVIPQFIRTYPNVNLRIIELTTDEIIEGLVKERLHAGILATPLEDVRLTEYPVGREPFMIYHSDQLSIKTNSDDMVHIYNLPTEHLILMNEGHCLRAQVIDLCLLKSPNADLTSFTLEAGSLTTLMRMVCKGPFFTILPALAVQDLIGVEQSGQCKMISAPVPYREISVVSYRTESRKVIRDGLIDLCRSELSNLYSESTFSSSPTMPRQ